MHEEQRITDSLKHMEMSYYTIIGNNVLGTHGLFNQLMIFICMKNAAVFGNVMSPEAYNKLPLHRDFQL